MRYVIMSTHLVLVKVSWCGACQQTLPEFKKAAVIAKHAPLKFVVIDHETSRGARRQLAEKLIRKTGVYPTIAKVKGTRATRYYRGALTADAIAAFAA